MPPVQNRFPVNKGFCHYSCFLTLSIFIFIGGFRGVLGGSAGGTKADVKKSKSLTILPISRCSYFFFFFVCLCSNLLKFQIALSSYLMVFLTPLETWDLEHLCDNCGRRAISTNATLMRCRWIWLGHTLNNPLTIIHIKPLWLWRSSQASKIRVCLKLQPVLITMADTRVTYLSDRSFLKWSCMSFNDETLDETLVFDFSVAAHLIL